MAASPAEITALADALERTMRALGAWSDRAPELRPFRLPFAMDAMPFEHWLQLVLAPRLREIAAAGGPLPPRSELAAHAVREFDGQDAMTPLVDVLRRIDDRCPPRREIGAPALGMGRPIGPAIALVLLVGGWAAVALQSTERVVPTLARFFPPTVAYSWTGNRPAGAELRPLRVTITAAVREDGRLDPTEATLVAIRSLRTLTHGPTAPLRFPVAAPPSEAEIATWLARYGADADAPLARAAGTEVLALLTAARTAYTPDALGAAGTAATPPLRMDGEPVAIPAHVPQWLQLGLAVGAVAAGAIPIALAVVRWGTRRR
jgi:uncharacterized protein YqcC (DUF446 family)